MEHANWNGFTGGNDESVYLSDIPFLCVDDYTMFPQLVQPLL